MKKYKKIFKEMPYVNYGDIMFDLEVERFRNIKNFLDYLDDIINGKVKTDKYGNEIDLKTKQEKRKFIQSLKNNDMFKKLTTYKMNDNEKKMLDLIMKI